MAKNIDNQSSQELHFYQKIATTSKNDGSNQPCSYFETLQHQAGIPANRKNGYYVKENSKDEDDFVNTTTSSAVNGDLSFENTSMVDNIRQLKQAHNDEEPNLQDDLDDIFSFGDKKPKNCQPEQNFDELNDGDFYNDFSVADEMIDNEENNRVQYREAIRSNPQYREQYNNSFYPNQGNNCYSYNAQNQSKKSMLADKNIIIIGIGIMCFFTLILLIILLILYIKNNSVDNRLANESIIVGNIAIEKPLDTKEIENENNYILAFPVRTSYVYDNDLQSVIGMKEKYTLVIADESNIKHGFIYTNTGYMNVSDLYEYDKTQEEFYNESISYFENYDKEHKSLREVLNIEDEIIIGNKEENIIKDKYTIFYDTNENISLLGSLGERLSSKNNQNNQGYLNATNSIIIELANGQQYGTLKIPSVGINAQLSYGMSQANIDKYDVCSSENFGIPGGNRSILIGGHNTNSLSKLTNVKIGDIIEIETTYGKFSYEVFYTGVGHVVNENTEVNDYLKDEETNEEIFSVNEDGEILGIFTCYTNPNDVQSPTPYRFAVKAKRISGELTQLN